MILMRQTCSQRSGMAAGGPGKRRAIAFYFSADDLQICYMFPISKCRGQSDLGLWMGLAKGMPLRSADFHRILFKNGKLALRSGILRGFARPEVMHRPTSDSPLHFDIGNR